MTTRNFIKIVVLCGVATLGAGCGDDDDGGPTMAPELTAAAWVTATPCAAGSPTDYTITLTATDGDTDAADLVFSGTVSGCSVPVCVANICTTNCPNAGLYGATMVVADPDGNMDAFMFSIDICTDGSAP